MASKKSTTVYVCSVCGEEFIQWQGKCSNCGEWNTLKEFSVPSAAARNSAAPVRGGGYSGAASVAPIKLVEVAGQQATRTPSGFSEVDRVLGGGIVPGSVTLIGGDPGIGKSTLLLQLVHRLAESVQRPVLYVSGEESPEQIRLRAERVGSLSPQIQLLAATNVEVIEGVVESNPPALLVIDSIQTMYDPAFPSTPGSIVQVRESALRIQQMAKRVGVPVILVGHITKDGTVAGPRTLEHLVDVVLYLEGDAQHRLRILRGVKNRFGDVSEVGIFAMEEEGMVEVKSPGGFLLEERIPAAGSVVSAIMEGTRPMLVEVQALTTSTVFGYPRRTSSGFDLNRLNLLLAVLQKRAGVNLSNHDVFINVVGGVKVKDTAVDAAICLALASAHSDTVIKENICVIGEVGLAGEIRKVSLQERRVKEITGLGFTVPSNVKKLSELLQKVLR